MAEPDTDYATHSGRVEFPRTPSDLTSTANCPACFRVLSGTVCRRCGLDLSHPAASELFETSVHAAELLDRRLESIGRIRFDTARRAASSPATHTPDDPWSSTAPDSESAPARPRPAPAPRTSAPVAARPPRHPASTAEEGTAPAPGRSSVQVALLLVGVSLLSIAAIFFLVYAFITFGLVWRAVIIGAITVAAIAVASALRRRRLTATAEGIAAFAVVLVYLDAYALRANDLVGLGSTDGSTYWGASLIVSSLGLLAWARTSALRVPSIAGFGTFAPGFGLLVAGLADGAQAGTRGLAALAAVALAALIFPAASIAGASTPAASSPAAPTSATPTRGAPAAVTPTPAGQAPPRRSLLPERGIVLGTAAVALLAAIGAALTFAPDADWASTVAIFGLAAVAALYVGILVLPRGDHGIERAIDRGFAAVFAGVAGAAAAGAVAAAALRIDDVEFIVFAPFVAATAVALLLEVVVRRTSAVAVRRPITVAAWSAATVVGMVSVVPAAVAVFTATVPPALGFIETWQHDAQTLLADPPDVAPWAVLGLAVGTVLAAGAWFASGRLRQRGPALVWAGGATAVLAVALLGSVRPLVIGWLVLGAGTLVALRILAARRPVTGRYRVPLLTVALSAGALGYATAWVSSTTWWWGSLTALILLLGARRLVGPRPRAVLLGGAVTAVLIGSAAVALSITFGTGAAPDVEAMNAIRVAGIAAGALLASAAAPLPRLVSTIDRRVTFWLCTGVSATSLLVLHGLLPQLAVDQRADLLLPEFGAGLFAGLLLLGALVYWICAHSTTPAHVERTVASLALAPTLYLVVSAAGRTLAVPELVGPVGASMAALLTAVGSLAVVLRRPTSGLRPVREAGVALVTLSAVWLAVRTDSGATWLVLVLAALTTLMMSISADGLFASASRRRHLGWLALALATAGLWWRLDGERITALEPYVLPPAAVLVFVAVLLQRSAAGRSGPADRASAPRPLPAAALIALGGLLLALLPLGVNGATGSPLRAAVVLAVSGALLLTGSAVRGSPGWRAYLNVAALGGGIGVLTTVIGRAGWLLARPGGSVGGELDLWLGAASLLLVTASFGLARRPAHSRPVGSRPVGSRPVGSRPDHDRPDDDRPNPDRPNPDTVRSRLGSALVPAALTLVLVFELPGIRADTLGFSRVLVLVFVFAAIHVAAHLFDRAPLARSIGWLAIWYAGVAAGAGAATGALDQVEWASVPIAVALLATGVLHLDAVPTARSWPWLGPGTAVLLVVPLLATIEDRPLWRLVGLGLLTLATVLISVSRRLQAPFVLGSVVLLTHGVATFLPQIRAVYQSVPWWLWLGVGGILLIVLAARYERRIRDVRAAATRLTTLR